ncbi:hypothetical protein NDU88_001689 [Pleurodeles waltl]|uniref:UDP-glucuronosyltransferase n=1 Tax=Pleurodeles waltl TaxID=8319 RepID=A0AAV7M612_PLEWA|nr:hypothetical protein NDU88_001689 [Pleurodeles waltl]
MVNSCNVLNLSFVFSCALLFAQVNVAGAAKILVVPVDGSHWVNIKILMMELLGRGHELTVVKASNAIYIEDQSDDFIIETIQMQPNTMTKEEVEKHALDWIFRMAFSKDRSSLSIAWEILGVIQQTTENHAAIIATMFENKELMERLGNTHFELVLADPYFQGGVMLAYHLKIPVVFFGRWLQIEEIHLATAPSPLSYVPVLHSRWTDRMSFVERCKNVLLYSLNEILNKFVVYTTYDELCQRYLKTDSGLYHLIKKADIFLMKVDFVFEFPRPIMPNAIYIGGFQCRPPKALPAEIQEFMDSSGDAGVVVFSLGTFLRTLPWELANKIAAGLARLPEHVIWRYTGETPLTLGNNTKILSWLPQNDLLSHPKTKAFIAHGGENGVYEAIYHGVPVIGFPVFGDQYENIMRLNSRGAAFLLQNLPDLTAEYLYNAVRTVIDDPSYRANMQRLSALHRDVQVHPMQTAIFWIEYTIRHKGASHLQAAGNDLPFYQYYLLDVIGLLGAVLLLSLCLAWKVLNAVVKRVCLGKRKKKRE